MLEAARIAAITVDCYGTLIDWEAGVGAYVAPHLERAAGGRVTLAEWLERWQEITPGLLASARPAVDSLAASFEQTMRSFELEVFSDGGPGLARSAAEWRPFPDAAPALRRIARRFRIGAISTLDGELTAQSLGRLGAPLALLVTADQASGRDEAPLREAVERLALPPNALLHASSGRSLGLARAAGLRTCRVRRGKQVADGRPADLEVDTLGDLADLLLADR